MARSWRRMLLWGAAGLHPSNPTTPAGCEDTRHWRHLSQRRCIRRVRQHDDRVWPIGRKRSGGLHLPILHARRAGRRVDWTGGAGSQTPVRVAIVAPGSLRSENARTVLFTRRSVHSAGAGAGACALAIARVSRVFHGRRQLPALGRSGGKGPPGAGRNLRGPWELWRRSRDECRWE